MSESNSSVPEPPYYAVVFTSQRRQKDDDGYAAMSARMVDLAAQQPGYLGIDSLRDAEGFGITVTSDHAVKGMNRGGRGGPHTRGLARSF